MKLKNLKTGFIFDVAEEVCEEFVKKDEETFAIVDENYVPKNETVVETPMFNSVVVEDENPSEFESKPDFDSMGRQELRDYCRQKGIKFSVTYGIDKMRELAKG